jgi:hypothetical protein
MHDYFKYVWLQNLLKFMTVCVDSVCGFNYDAGVFPQLLLHDTVAKLQSNTSAITSPAAPYTFI